MVAKVMVVWKFPVPCCPGSASGAGAGLLCTLCCSGCCGHWGQCSGHAVGHGLHGHGSSVLCSALREEQTCPCRLFSDRGAPERLRAWLAGCLHSGVCFPDLQTCPAPCRGHTPQEQGCAASAVGAELRGSSWVRHGSGGWGTFLRVRAQCSTQSQLRGLPGPTRLSTVSREPQTQSSVLEGDHEAGAAPPRGSVPGPGSQELGRDGTRTHLSWF